MKYDDLVKRLFETAEWHVDGVGELVNEAAFAIEQLHRSHAALLKACREMYEILDETYECPTATAAETIHAAEALERDGGEA